MSKNGELQATVPVAGLYKDYFLDYASYVILERAVPTLDDGLKPVQRRILHAMFDMHDGRFHKCANIIGQTMQYHPHGDAAIGDALVNIGQKELLIEPQGNWGDVRTGDPAAAARYIEARLSKFAQEVAFNTSTTEWQLSYDGRKKEPVTLPIKFPMVLAQGAEGIAVGLATKILPHNFCELIEGSIKSLKGRKPNVVPDFPTGGMVDVSEYNGGQRGGKIRVRVHVELVDKKTLRITDVPYGVTTTSLIDSILKANDRGKIKVKRVQDNTAQEVEILVELASGVSPTTTIDALYAFTDCEVSISPNCCVIADNKPQFLTVNQLLRTSTENTRQLLKRELEIRKKHLEERWHFSSLERIFIEKRIYRKIEECETWEAVISTIDKGLKPYVKSLKRKVTEEDIVKLTEIKIKRISKYDSFKADELLKDLESQLKQVRHDLKHLTEYAIAYFHGLLEKYGDGRERKTEIKTFDTIQAKQVAVINTKLYVNRKDGFIGWGLKGDEFVKECSDIDDIIAFCKDGTCRVSRIAEKVFMGKDILHVDVWKKGNEHMVYHMIYADLKSGKNYVKRFTVPAITRDKEYNIGSADAKVVYFTANPNSESERVAIYLTQSSRARIKEFPFDFGELDIKGRGVKGNIISRYPIRKVTQEEVGAATLGGRKIWLDEDVGRLNTDERGRLLGEFDTDDTILVVHADGSYEETGFDLSNRYEMEKIKAIAKWEEGMVVSCVYYDGDKEAFYVKRFELETLSIGQRFSFIGEKSRLEVASVEDEPRVKYKTGRGKAEKTVSLAEFIDVKGWKAQGNKLGEKRKVVGLALLASGIAESPEEQLEQTITEKKRSAAKATPKKKATRAEPPSVKKAAPMKKAKPQPRKPAKAKAKPPVKKVTAKRKAASTKAAKRKPRNAGKKAQPRKSSKKNPNQGKLFDEEGPVTFEWDV